MNQESKRWEMRAYRPEKQGRSPDAKQMHNVGSAKGSKPSEIFQSLNLKADSPACRIHKRLLYTI